MEIIHRVVKLLSEENKDFIFSDSEEFKNLSEIDRFHWLEKTFNKYLHPMYRLGLSYAFALLILSRLFQKAFRSLHQ